MARCDDEDCTTFMPESSAVWFKVQEKGRVGTTDEWGTVSNGHTLASPKPTPR